MDAIARNTLIQLKEFGIVKPVPFQFVVIVLKKQNNFGNRKMFLLMKRIISKMLDKILCILLIFFLYNIN